MSLVRDIQVGHRVSILYHLPGPFASYDNPQPFTIMGEVVDISGGRITIEQTYIAGQPLASVRPAQISKVDIFTPVA